MQVEALAPNDSFQVNINRDLIYSDLKQETLKNNNNILFQQGKLKSNFLDKSSVIANAFFESFKLTIPASCSGYFSPFPHVPF